MKLNSYKIVATLIGLSLSLAVAGNAVAQDGYGYGDAGNTQAQQVPANDNNYAVPPAYDGEYYPQEYQGATGYYGTTNTSDNRGTAQAAGEDQYYNYYY